MSKIVTLGGADLPEPGKPVENVVEALEEMLAEAKAGEIAGFAAVYVDHKIFCGYRLHGNYIGATRYSAVFEPWSTLCCVICKMTLDTFLFSCYHDGLLTMCCSILSHLEAPRLGALF